MKLVFKPTGEVVDAVFEGCEGNLVIVNKNTKMSGEYATLREFRRDFVDYYETPYSRQYRYAKTEKGCERKKEANKRYYLKKKAKAELCGEEEE